MGIFLGCREAGSSPARACPVPPAQVLKSEVQGLARAVDSKGSSVASLAADRLGEINRLAGQAKRCKDVIDALDGLIQVRGHPPCVDLPVGCFAE